MQYYLNLLVAQETHHFNIASIKCQSPIRETQVLPQEGKTCPNNVLMSGQCVGERILLEFVFRYGYRVSVKMSKFNLEHAKQTVLC